MTQDDVTALPGVPQKRALSTVIMELQRTFSMVKENGKGIEYSQFMMV